MSTEEEYPPWTVVKVAVLLAILALLSMHSHGWLEWWP